MTSDTRLESARAAGTRALQSLDEAADQLDSARNWGLLDILGGGILTEPREAFPPGRRLGGGGARAARP